VPLPNILDRLLGYFSDPKLAFVQSPQDFYNTDSFTHVVNDEGRQMWEENRLFFSLIQPGKDRMNAAFFCGSCGVLRRSAFDEIGGFVPGFDGAQDFDGLMSPAALGITKMAFDLGGGWLTLTG